MKILSEMEKSFQGTCFCQHGVGIKVSDVLDVKSGILSKGVHKFPFFAGL